MSHPAIVYNFCVALTGIFYNDPFKVFNLESGEIQKIDICKAYAYIFIFID